MRSGKSWLEEYLKYVDNTEPPILYHEWTGVMTLAAVLKRKVWLRWGINDTLFPNLYTILVGPAGKCRKGTAMKAGLGLIRTLGGKVSPSSVTREALIKELSESTTQEITDQGLFITHASLTVWSPEWSVFLGGRENMQLIMDLTDWFDCPDNWEYVTKTQGRQDISCVWFNMFGAITPSALKSVLPYEAVGAGLTSRIIFVYEEFPAKKVPAPFETPDLQAKRAVLASDLSEIAALNGPFEMTAAALDFYTDWYMTMEQHNPNLPEMFEGYINRRQTHLRKLAMIMSVSESNDKKITQSHFEKALDLLERTEVKMPRTFAGMGSGKDSQLNEDIMVYIARHRRVSAVQIYRDFRSFISGPRHFDEIMGALLHIRFVTLESTPNGTFYNYNTKNTLHTQYAANYSGSSNTP